MLSKENFIRYTISTYFFIFFIESCGSTIKFSFIIKEYSLLPAMSESDMDEVPLALLREQMRMPKHTKLPSCGLNEDNTISDADSEDLPLNMFKAASNTETMASRISACTLPQTTETSCMNEDNTVSDTDSEHLQLNMLKMTSNTETDDSRIPINTHPHMTEIKPASDGSNEVVAPYNNLHSLIDSDPFFGVEATPELIGMDIILTEDDQMLEGLAGTLN